VPLGIELKSEQHLGEMIDILALLHKYVPTVSTPENVLVDGKSDEIVEDKFSIVLLGQYIAIQLYMCVFIFVSTHR